MEDDDELQIAEWDRAAADAAYRQQVSSSVVVSIDIFVSRGIEFWGSESGTRPRPPPSTNSRYTCAARFAQSVWTNATDVASRQQPHPYLEHVSCLALQVLVGRDPCLPVLVLLRCVYNDMCSSVTCAGRDRQGGGGSSRGRMGGGCGGAGSLGRGRSGAAGDGGCARRVAAAGGEGGRRSAAWSAYGGAQAAAEGAACRGKAAAERTDPGSHLKTERRRSRHIAFYSWQPGHSYYAGRKVCQHNGSLTVPAAVPVPPRAQLWLATVLERWRGQSFCSPDCCKPQSRCQHNPVLPAATSFMERTVDHQPSLEGSLTDAVCQL